MLSFQPVAHHESKVEQKAANTGTLAMQLHDTQHWPGWIHWGSWNCHIPSWNRHWEWHALWELSVLLYKSILYFPACPDLCGWSVTVPTRTQTSSACWIIPWCTSPTSPCAAECFTLRPCSSCTEQCGCNCTVPCMSCLDIYTALWAGFTAQTVSRSCG